MTVYGIFPYQNQWTNLNISLILINMDRYFEVCQTILNKR